ncbi:MAG TPA: PA2169 family four-helix-bundle protein [Steroidobacteraceae bacterium]
MRTAQTITTLNRLIRICRDAEGSSRSWSRAAASAELRSRLMSRSEEWGRHGDELQALVLLLGGRPETAGSVGAQLRQLWSLCHGTFLGRDDLAALLACEQARQHALGCYDRALEDYLPERIRRTLSLQARQISSRTEPLAGRVGHFAAH